MSGTPIKLMSDPLGTNLSSIEQIERELQGGEA